MSSYIHLSLLYLWLNSFSWNQYLLLGRMRMGILFCMLCHMKFDIIRCSRRLVSMVCCIAGYVVYYAILYGYVVSYDVDSWYTISYHTKLHTHIVIGWYQYGIQYWDSEPCMQPLYNMEAIIACPFMWAKRFIGVVYIWGIIGVCLMQHGCLM